MKFPATAPVITSLIEAKMPILGGIGTEADPIVLAAHEAYDESEQAICEAVLTAAKLPNHVQSWQSSYSDGEKQFDVLAYTLEQEADIGPGAKSEIQFHFDITACWELVYGDAA